MEYFKNCMTIEELDAEHKKLVIRLHPDRNPGNPDATAEFQEMQAQYEERKAELNGDYTKARKGRERREREARERREREAREKARRKVEQVVEAARLNRQKRHSDLKVGDYIYARMANPTQSMFEWDHLSGSELLRVVLRKGVREECVVFVETIFDMTDRQLLEIAMSSCLSGDIYGGYEVLQPADLAGGVRKGKRVAKVAMFRSPRFCLLGNPMGDGSTITDYYLPVGYETMFSDELHRIKADIDREDAEKARLEAERKARIIAEQTPLIEAWKPKLIEISQGLTNMERMTVAVNNFKVMLKEKFPGTKFSVKANRYGRVCVHWEDGPVFDDVCAVMDLFDAWQLMGGKEPTPWMEHYGRLDFDLGDLERKMSVLTKARILQQLGDVTDTFRSGEIHDEVTVSDYDWMMLHLLVGISVGDAGAHICQNTLHADGKRTVKIQAAVNFVFRHTSYVKPRTARKKAA